MERRISAASAEMSERNSPKLAGRSLLNRARVTNGSELLAYVDERSAYARRFRDVLAEILSDNFGDDASAAVKALARRAACLIVEMELLESKFANAGEASTKQLDAYARASGALKRLFDVLGIDRKARDLTPTVEEYARQVREREGAAA